MCLIRTTIGHCDLRRLMQCWLFLALLASGLTGCKRSGNQAIALATNLGAGRDAHLAYSFGSGNRMVYQLDYKSTSNSDIRVLFESKQMPDREQKVQTSGRAQSAKGSVRGELVLTVIERSNDRVLLAYSLRNTVLSLNINDEDLVKQADAISRDLSTGVFVEADLQGKIISLLFDPSVTAGSQNFARALIGAVQFVLPNLATSDLREWEVEEESAAGRYVAHYEEVPRHDNGDATNSGEIKTIRKTVRRYVQQSRKRRPTDLDLPVNIETSGGLTGNFDASNGRLTSLAGSESRATVISGKTISQTDTTIRLDLLSAGTLDPKELVSMREARSARERTGALISLYVPRSERESQESVYRNDLGNATIDALLDDLLKLETSIDKTKDDTGLYLKFKAIVFLHPESSARLARILAAADPNGRTMRLLSGALGTVGNPPAQEALIEVIKARWDDWPALAQLIPSLGLVSSPTSESENTLRALAKSPRADIASTAQLSLGVMARNLTEESPGRAAGIVDWAVRELEASSSVDTRIQMLLVLGNSGSERALPAIVPFLSSPESSLRATAASAMRWIDSTETEALLLKTLTSDTDASVRSEAAAALAFRQMSAGGFSEQRKVLLTDKDDKVRLAVLNNLWKAHEAFPEVRQLVKDTADKDASPDVRKAAADIVTRYSDTYFKR